MNCGPVFIKIPTPEELKQKQADNMMKKAEEILETIVSLLEYNEAITYVVFSMNKKMEDYITKRLNEAGWACHFFGITSRNVTVCPMDKKDDYIMSLLEYGRR